MVYFDFNFTHTVTTSIAMFTTKETSSAEFPTLTELKHSIPRSCFESDASTSLYYVARSVALTAALMTGLTYARDAVADWLVLDVAVSLAYAYVQGVVFWGVFTIGHDCGHSSFSRYHNLNFIVGCITHSAILTPFESWRITHRHHHKNTGNVDKDEVFYPPRAKDVPKQTAYSPGMSFFNFLKQGYAGDAHTLSHNIGTHQVHHLFPIIPHYKLNEATSHFRKAYPHLVRVNTEPIVGAYFKTLDLFVRHGSVPDDAEVFTLGAQAKAAKKAL
ncbi:hypothetical protein H257_04382 [Aphanomyces astaci]|uniref:Fatty acid desaturase domain-containing protein n=1 Tax=Aphanomyces astaci TaxID=112090 RepID=W4GVJ2_APHAT|nr:hypothetical protein H257_04382 [Aphanomyces astaci]ETV83735.1 hypothetical protein H257_04382 [Aphanomyces astaci]|eukprot:XP_009827165.1 hypothetical protein H257_04382 [Aphanomyces astaci]